MHLVVGTSGHIDHGKTTLVRALTGIDADRWAEEKQRGITIDLGFAHYTDERGNTIAFVDVPGHERFVHNMLAGAAGFDAVLMVIAADEGVMPQTREHLAICDLLGITQGIVALTRADVVDEELLTLCTEDVREAVQGTFLAGAPIIPCSGVSGQGLEALREALGRLTLAKAHDADHPFRFPVDRSFSVKGFGTVVTGTLIAGQVQRDASVTQYPAGQDVRIRGLQVHGEAVETARAGQRAALNLGGVAREAIRRGDQLAAPDSLLTSLMLNVELTLLPDAPRDLTQRTRVRLHQGTQEVLGRLVLLEGERLLPGETQLVQMRLESPVSTRFGDRFIIRNYSPVFTLGGGRILDPAPQKSRRLREGLPGRLRQLAGDDEAARVEQVIYLQGTRGVREREGFIRAGLGERAFHRAVERLASQGTIFAIDPQEKKYLHADTMERLGAFVERVLAAHHRAHPEREGMSRAELAGKLSALFSEREVGHLLSRLARTGRIAQSEQAWHLPGHEKAISGAQEDLLQQMVAAIEAGGAQPPRKTVLLQELGVDSRKGTQVLQLGTHNQRLVRVKDDLYYTPQQLKDIEARLRAYLGEHEQISVVDFKDLVGVSRKHAVDLLEHFDAERVTIRLDNHRVLREGAAR